MKVNVGWVGGGSDCSVSEGWVGAVLGFRVCEDWVEEGFVGRRLRWLTQRDSSCTSMGPSLCWIPTFISCVSFAFLSGRSSCLMRRHDLGLLSSQTRFDYLAKDKIPSWVQPAAVAKPARENSPRADSHSKIFATNDSLHVLSKNGRTTNKNQDVTF